MIFFDTVRMALARIGLEQAAHGPDDAGHRHRRRRGHRADGRGDRARRRASTSKVAGSGSNLIFVRPAHDIAGRRAATCSATSLTSDDADAINDPPQFPEIEGVDVAVARSSTRRRCANGGNVRARRVIAARADYPLVRDYLPAKGRFIDNQDDIERRARDVCSARRSRDELFGDEQSAMGQTVRIDRGRSSRSTSRSSASCDAGQHRCGTTRTTRCSCR